MARTIVVDEIRKGDSATPANVSGIAKAWVQADGTGTVSILGSMNISSMTDEGTGEYSFDMTSAMSSGAYAAVASGDKSSDNAVPSGRRTAPTSTKFGTRYYNPTSLNDVDYVMFSVSGDLA